jgi:hypothetical protein
MPFYGANKEGRQKIHFIEHFMFIRLYDAQLSKGNWFDLNFHLLGK